MNHIIDLVIQNKDNNITSNIEVEPECTISLTHKLITFEINIKKPEIIRKNITFRNKTNFDAKSFIDTCLNEIARLNVNCECERGNNQPEEQYCVSCFTAQSENILSTRYNEKCPIIEKTIREYEKSKWFNNELKAAKKCRKNMEDKWKRKKTAENWNNYKKS